MSNKQITELVTTDVQLGMNEVVNVFVSRYEDELHTRKTELQKQVRELKGRMKDHDTEVLNAYRSEGDQYEVGSDILGLSSEVTDVSVLWDHKEGKAKAVLPIVRFKIKITDDDEKDVRYGRSEIEKTRQVEIDEGDVTLHRSLDEQLSTTQSELQEVLVAIKQVSRKERQIRGKISEQRLEAGGYGELLNNPELLQLCKLD